MKISKKVVDSFWKQNMVICSILKESSTPEIASDHLHSYLSEQWKMLYQKEEEKQLQSICPNEIMDCI